MFGPQKFTNVSCWLDGHDVVSFFGEYTHFTTPDRYLSKYTQHFIKTHTNIINFDTFGGKIPQRDLRISPSKDI